MENTELQKWIAFFAGISFFRVKFEPKAESSTVAKFRRFVGPKNFDDKYSKEKNWFYIEVILYEDEIRYEFKKSDNEDNFGRKDESSILFEISETPFTKATGSFETMKSAIAIMSEKLDFLINYPTPYIKKKLEGIPVEEVEE